MTMVVIGDLSSSMVHDEVTRIMFRHIRELFRNLIPWCEAHHEEAQHEEALTAWLHPKSLNLLESL